MASKMLDFAIRFLALDNASAKIQSLQNKVADFQKTADSLNVRGKKSIMEGFGQAATAGAFMLPLAKTVMDASKLEDVFGELSNVAGMTGDKIGQVDQAYFEFVKSHSANQIDYVKSATAFAKAGLQGAAGIEATNAALRLSKATMSGAFESTEVLSEVYAAVGNKSANVGSEMERLSNTLARLREVSPLKNMTEISQAMTKSLSTIVQYGVSFEETGAAVSLFTKKGLQFREAGETMKGVLSGMQNASRQLGFQIAKDADGGMDFAATIDNIQRRFGNLNDMPPQLKDRLRGAFGEGFKGISLLLDGTDEYRKTLLALKDSTGAVDRLEEMNKTSFAENFLSFKNALSSVSGQIGTIFLPIATKMFTVAAWGLNTVSNLIHSSPTLQFILKVSGGILAGISAFMAYSAAIKIAQGAFFILSGGALNMIASLASLGLGFAAATVKAFAFAAALLANPITWIVAGVIALGYGIYKLIEHWDTVKQKAVDFFKSCIEFASPVLDIFSKVGNFFGFGDKSADLNISQEKINTLNKTVDVQSSLPKESPAVKSIESQERVATLRPVGQTVNNSPSVNITLNASGSTEAQGIKKVLENYSQDILKTIEKAQRNKERRAY